MDHERVSHHRWTVRRNPQNNTEEHGSSRTKQTNPERKQPHPTPRQPRLSPRAPELSFSLSWIRTCPCCMSLIHATAASYLPRCRVHAVLQLSDQGELHSPISFASAKRIVVPHLLPNIRKPSGWRRAHQQQAQSECLLWHSVPAKPLAAEGQRKENCAQCCGCMPESELHQVLGAMRTCGMHA
jgi:hypothetical protein